MRAARYHGNKDVRVEQIPEPSLGSGQVKVAPAFVGICGSDLHEYLGGPMACPTKAHGITGDSIPVTLGHEFSGVITEIGSDVTGFRVGQACAIRPNLNCGKCPTCEEGAWNLCSIGGFIGLSGGAGGLCDMVCIDPKHIVPLPDNVSLEYGALVEPLSVAWHAISTVPKINPESVVLIIGGGPIGLAATLCLKAQGINKIIVSEVSDRRRDFATHFGAAKVINPIKEDVAALIMEVSEKRGADVVLDCAGVVSALKSAFEVIRPRGTIVNVAAWERDIQFNPNWLMLKEISYTATIGYAREDFDAVIEMLSKGLINPDGMVTSKIKLENIVEDGFRKLIDDKDNQIKVLVDMKAS